MSRSLPQPILSATSKAMLHAPLFAKPLFTGGMKLLGMPLSAKFAAYAMDFEQALKSDRWDAVARHFAPDAVYHVRNMGPSDALMRGREAIVAGFKRSLDGFDRKLDRRIAVTEGPHERGSEVSFVWVGTYGREGAPPLVLSARQSAIFQDGAITQLSDDFLPGMAEQAALWLQKHGGDLDPSYTDQGADLR